MDKRRSYNCLIYTMRIPVLVRRHLYIESASGSVTVLAEADIIVIQETRAIYRIVPLVDHRVVVTFYERSDCDINPGGLYTAFNAYWLYTRKQWSSMTSIWIS